MINSHNYISLYFHLISSLLSSYFVKFAGEKGRAALERDAENQCRLFQMQMHKGMREYMAGIVKGRTVLRADAESDISIETDEMVKGIIMQHIHTDFSIIRDVTSSRECLILPVVRFHTVDSVGDPSPHGYMYKVTIPHCLPRNHDSSSIRVRYGDIFRGPLREMKLGTPEEGIKPFYEIQDKSITVYANHFCDVVCTSAQKICTSNILALPFGLIRTFHIDSGVQTNVKVKIFLCSILYNSTTLKKVRWRICSNKFYSPHDLLLCQWHWFLIDFNMSFDGVFFKQNSKLKH